MSELQTLSITMEHIKTKVGILCDAVLGDPSNEQHPGILIRLDRLERSNAMLKKVISWIAAALSVVAGTVLAGALMKVF